MSIMHDRRARDRLSYPMRILAALVVGAIGIALAASIRTFTLSLSGTDKWWCGAAMLLGIIWPFWKFVQLNRNSK